MISLKIEQEDQELIQKYQQEFIKD